MDRLTAMETFVHVVETGSFSAAAKRLGIGLAMTSEWMFSPELARGEVKPVLTDWELPPKDLWAVLPTGRMPSAKAKAFIEYVEGLLRK